MFFLPALLPMAIPVAVVAVVLAHQRKQGGKRSKTWASWAAARNWGYTGIWPDMAHRFSRRPFGIGTGRAAERGFWGRFDNVDVFGFNYRYTTQSGRNRITVRQHIAGVRFPGANFPELMIAREGSVLLGGRDIQFENEQFNRAWYVNGPSRRFAHDVMHPRAMEFLLGPVPPFDRIWFDRDVLFASIQGDPDPVRVDAHLRMLTQFAGLLPSFTLRELGAAGGVSPDLSGPGIPLAEQQRRMAHWQQMQSVRGRGRWS